MKARSYALYLLTVLALCGSFIAAEDFILDLGGVTLDTNKKASLRHLGMMNIAQYSFHLKMNPLKVGNHIKTMFFATLEKAAALDTFNTPDTLHLAYDETGNILPVIMRAWLQGTMSCSEIRLFLNDAITLHPEWFTHPAEQRIVKNMLNMIFTPYTLQRSALLKNVNDMATECTFFQIGILNPLNYSKKSIRNCLIFLMGLSYLVILTHSNQIL
jgi:hypothetical protein